MALPVVMAAIAGGAALAKGISGAVQASKARKALENFQRQELRNITEGMRVSTLGAQLQTQEAQRRFATSVEALRSGGVRGVVGGLGQQEVQQQQLQRQISADLDRQQMQIEQMRAQDEARIQAMQEQRETFDIGRLAGQQAAGRAQLSSAIGDIGSLATSFISPAGTGRPKDLTTLDTNLASELETKKDGFLGLFGKETTRTTGTLGEKLPGFNIAAPTVSDYTIKPIR